MREVDVRLAEVKSKYGEAMPELLLRNQSAVEDTQRQLDTLQQQILTAQEKESVFALQLSQMSPNLITQSGDLTDVATVRAKLTEAEQRYTPDHPEVKRLRRALETLMAADRRSAPTGGAQEAANNPQYLLTEAQLQSARNELANLQAHSNATAGRSSSKPHAWCSRRRRRNARSPRCCAAKKCCRTNTSASRTGCKAPIWRETFESQQGGERFTMVRAPARAASAGVSEPSGPDHARV